MKKHISKLLWMGWFVLAPFVSGGQNLQSDEISVDPAFTYDHWTVEDGLPVNSINEIIQSSDGYIWFGTFDGLVRFDGVRFKVYKSAEYEGLPSNRIVNIIEASDGTLWMKTEQNDLARFRDGSFQHMTEKDGLNGNSAYTFWNGPGNTLWIGADNGISVYQNGNLVPYRPDIITNRVTNIYVDQAGTLWYKEDTELGLYRFDGEKKTYLASAKTFIDAARFMTMEDGRTIFGTMGHLYIYEDGQVSEVVPELPSDFEVVDLYQDSTGTVFVASRFRGLFKLTDNDWTNINPENTGRVWEVFLAENGNLWAAGNQKLFFNNRVVFSFDKQISDFMFDREGSFWFGTSSTGLHRLKPSLFTIYSEEEGVPYQNIYPVNETSDGSIWFGTYGEGPVRLKDGNLTHSFPFHPTPTTQNMRSILERENGDLLISLLADGLYKFNLQNQAFERLETPDGNSVIADVLTVATLYEDSRQWLWAGNEHGLFVKKKSDWQKIPDKDSDPGNVVRYVTEAPDSSLWMATNGGGILHYKSGEFQSYTIEDSLSSNLVRSLHVDTTGAGPGYILWLGTEDKGLNRLPVIEDEPVFDEIIIYNQQNGLYSNVVHQILVDDYNRFWMSGNQGIYWVTREQLNKFADGEITEINSTGYTEQDGLRNREANGGIQPAGIKSTDGRLWFPTQDGLVAVDPDKIPGNEIPPPVMVEEINSGEKLIPRSKNGMLVLAANQRDFEINYTGLSFIVPEKVRFRYRLKNFNNNWIEAGTRRTAFYTNVPPGEYEFEVLAANNEGVWSPEPASLSIEVQPFLYETTAFYVGLFVLGGLLVVGLIQLRTARLKKKETELEKSVQARTRELEKEKEKTETQAQELRKVDEMKNQLFTNISHEFRTPLTLIISPLKKMLRNDNKTLPDEVTPKIDNVLRNSHRLQRLIDQILDLSKLEAGELTPQVCEMEMVSFLQKMTNLFKPLSREQNQTLDFETDLGELHLFVDSDALEKVLANLISNAIKFTPSGGKIAVELLDGDDECQIKVSDSGIGIPPEKQSEIFERFYQVDASSTRAAEGTGIGLALVKNLVELHQGTISVDSEVGEGTVFTVNLKRGKKHFNESDIDPDAKGKVSIDRKARIFSGYVRDLNEQEEQQDLDRPTVLVVEDNADMRAFVASVLSETFSVVQAGDGEAALDLIKENLPDLIVADIMMPKMDGMQLNEELKKDPMLETIPVIFLTAKTESDSKLEGFREGADDYLTKPFDADLLTARVQNIIQKRQQLRKRILEQGIASSTEEEIPDPFLQDVREVMEQHFADPDFGISELSEAVHLDRTQLYRRIKEASGESPQQFLSSFRMKKAVQMMEEKAGNISEVAYATGFNSLSYFSKVFRRHYNISPSDFLNQSHSIS